MAKNYMLRDKDKMHEPAQAPSPLGALLTGLGGKPKAEEEHHGIAHISSVGQLTGVLMLLLLLTFITVGVTWFDFGAFNLLIAMLIAVIKASFVVLYFMHLKYERPLNAIVLIAALLFVMLFVDFALVDTHQYKASQIPDYAPKIKH